ncbi:MAG TPA: hypothetical protein VMU10_04000, partial [Desulfomonilia bacterium]|nr:hypothetical protein [Desulfomonilia bacterium]
LFIIQLVQETMAALQFGLHVFDEPLAVPLTALFQQMIAPLVLWRVISGRIYPVHQGLKHMTA